MEQILCDSAVSMCVYDLVSMVHGYGRDRQRKRVHKCILVLVWYLGDT